MSGKTPKRKFGDTPASGTPSGSSARKYRGSLLKSAEEKKKQARERMRRMREKRARELQGDIQLSSDEEYFERSRNEGSLLASFSAADSNQIPEEETGKLK